MQEQHLKDCDCYRVEYREDEYRRKMQEQRLKEAEKAAEDEQRERALEALRETVRALEALRETVRGR